MISLEKRANTKALCKMHATHAKPNINKFSQKKNTHSTQEVNTVQHNCIVYARFSVCTLFNKYRLVHHRVGFLIQQQCIWLAFVPIVIILLKSANRQTAVISIEKCVYMRLGCAADYTEGVAK